MKWIVLACTLATCIAGCDRSPTKADYATTSTIGEFFYPQMLKETAPSEFSSGEADQWSKASTKSLTATLTKTFSGKRIKTLNYLVSSVSVSKDGPIIEIENEEMMLESSGVKRVDFHAQMRESETDKAKLVNKDSRVTIDGVVDSVDAYPYSNQLVITFRLSDATFD